MPSLFLLVNISEPQSINAKLVLPTIPIGIVAYAFTLVWDNLCRNSCIKAQVFVIHYANCVLVVIVISTCVVFLSS